jgi:adenine-specific DNA-methyltransferase
MPQLQNKHTNLSTAIQVPLFGFDFFGKEGVSEATLDVSKIEKVYFYPKVQNIDGKFQIQNRRYLGNKFKLINFIRDIVNEKCGKIDSFCDIFAGTGVVGEGFNDKDTKIISNDILLSNYLPLKTFLDSKDVNLDGLKAKIDLLNSVEANDDNYFSKYYGDTYFTLENAKKIGAIREKIGSIAESEEEKSILITSLIYAADKVANTVGHYDAYRKNLDSVNPLELLVPTINLDNNINNEVYKEDANTLIRKIKCDVLYMDPPYNSRQYCDSYHLLENLVEWKKPEVYGKAKKMDRTHLKSEYCLRSAKKAFEDLIENANCKHILVSYNNTGEKKDGRSNSRIKDSEIVNTLKKKGDVEVFERDYKAFSTGRSETEGHTERVFYCKVKN